jgi:hypothetical protein
MTRVTCLLLKAHGNDKVVTTYRLLLRGWRRGAKKNHMRAMWTSPASLSAQLTRIPRRWTAVGGLVLYLTELLGMRANWAKAGKCGSCQ